MRRPRYVCMSKVEWTAEAMHDVLYCPAIMERRIRKGWLCAFVMIGELQIARARTCESHNMLR
jgi:hypothetical protein